MYRTVVGREYDSRDPTGLALLAPSFVTVLSRVFDDVSCQNVTFDGCSMSGKECQNESRNVDVGLMGCRKKTSKSGLVSLHIAWI